MVLVARLWTPPQRIPWLVLAVGIVGLIGASQLGDGTLEQRGPLHAWDARDLVRVQFGIPYAVPPNLEIRCDCTYEDLNVTPLGFTVDVLGGSHTEEEQWIARGIVDERLDPRPTWNRWSVGEKFFGAITFVGSVASIYTVAVSLMHKRT